MKSRLFTIALCMILAPACGDDGSSGDTGAASSATMGTTAATVSTTAGGTESTSGTTEQGADASGFCPQYCKSSLTIRVPANSGDYTVQMDLGTGFIFSVSCPSEEIGGNAGSHRISCAGSTITVEADSITFGETITLAFNDGPDQLLMPDYTEVPNECDGGPPCNEATVDLYDVSGTSTGTGTGTGTGG
jgi:hypothetical protein